MKKFLSLSLSLALMASLLSGCGTVKTIFGGKSSKAEDKAYNKIVTIENKQNDTNVKRLDLIGQYGYGTSLALSKTNVPIATTLNERVIELANKPSFKDIASIKSMVDDLISTNSIRLQLKDNEIISLENTISKLNVARDEAISDYEELANKTAMIADKTKSELSEYQGWFGLKAIFKGFTTFIKSAFWFLIIFSVLFLIVRLLASSNPIASAVFNVFESGMSIVVKGIEKIFPKAVPLAGNVSGKLFSSYKSTLTKVIDAVETTKTKSEASGKTATIKEYLDEAEKSMNDDEKAIVDEIKKLLNWN